MEIGGKPFPLTVLKGGINRLRIKGGASPSSLYDLLNAYVDITGGVQPRPGTIRTAALDTSTKGLTFLNGNLQVFSISAESMPSGFQDNVLVNPTNAADTLKTIWFSAPFMGFLYVAAEFASGAVFHYWLQSSGPWTAATVFQNGTIILPTTPNGLAYQAVRLTTVNPTWTPETVVALNDQVEPTLANGYFFEATNVEGATPHTGLTEPTWPASVGATVQEFGDFTAAAGAAAAGTALPLSATITDRYGNSGDVAGIAASTAGAVAILPTALPATTVWAKGTTYPRGSVVTPSTTQGAVVNAIPNGDFENGDDGSWVFTGSGEALVITESGVPFQGLWNMLSSPGATAKIATMSTKAAVTPGTSVTATCMISTGSSGGSKIVFHMNLNWYDASSALITTTVGSAHSSQGGWSQINVTAVAPALAAFVNVAIEANSGTADRDTGSVDLVQWNLETPSPVSNFIFEAVQSGTGVSASTEPTWPSVAGETVIDGSVTWQAVGSSIITWTAFPIMLSGATEPTWPTTIGQQVANGNMAFIAVSRQIIDANCPNTKGVTLGASHVFAIDDDIVAYSAAVDPTDWTTTENAGYLPTGLNNYGQNPMAVLSLYRGNLIAMNAGGYQMWQIDPDPQNMALLDAQPVGSTYTRSAQSIATDNLFLTFLGLRSIGTTGATANLQTGMVGQPIDPLVKAALTAGTYAPIAFYYPARGQYWVGFGPQVFVLTVNGNNQKSWSRYVFPDAITDFTLAGEVMYLRSAGNLIWQVDENTLVDDLVAATVTISHASPAVVTWANSNLRAGETVVFTTTGTLPAPLAPSTAYYVSATSLAAGSFKIAATVGGTPIVTTTAGSGTHTATAYTEFEGVIQWPWLDLSNFGYNKMLDGFDIVGTGTVTVNLLWDETNLNAMTPDYVIEGADTLPGQPVAMPINAPSMSLKLTFAANQVWSWQSANLYAQPTGSNG